MKRILISFLFVIIAAGALFFVWQTQNEKAKAAKTESEILKSLTAEEIGYVLKSEALAGSESIKAITADTERRQIFLKGLREHLALAAQARREGFAEDENFKVNLEYKKNILLADLYRFYLSQGKDRLYVVPENEIKKVWANPANEKLFGRDMKVLKDIRIADAKAKGNFNPVSEVSPEAEKNWARTKILSDTAKADAEFTNQKAIPLRLKILEAGILSSDYLRAKYENFKVSDKEIADYLAAHPEYSVEKKRQKAEEILQRAKGGEDFAELAKKYSEDRGSGENGGLYEDVGKDVLWTEVENAALNMKKGKIADQLIESGIGFHIVKLIDKKVPKNGDGKNLKYTVRHIVLQKNFQEPNNNISGIPSPFMTAEEIAKAEIEKEKHKKFVNEIVEKNPISLPPDFSVELLKGKNRKQSNFGGN